MTTPNPVSNLMSLILNGLESFQLSGGGTPGGANFGGSGFETNTAQMTNTTRGVPVSTTSGTVAWPSTGNNGGVLAQYSTIVLTAALTGGLTIDLPPSPMDGQVVEIVNGTSAAFTSAVTVAVTDGSTLVNGGSVGDLAAGASVQFFYLNSSNTWYRMR